MVYFKIFLLPFLLSFLALTTKNIEKSFFQNDPRLLIPLLSSRNHVNISLPEPISFSDRLSREQTYFFFRKIFSVYSTFEFYLESGSPPLERDSYIFKARWSFKNKKNNNQYVFHIFFLLKNEARPKAGPAAKPAVKGKKYQPAWRIIEIRAEKI